MEVDGARCVELIDDVCATAALTEERQEYMELVEVVHIFSVLLPLPCCVFCARTGGRQTDAEQVSAHESERAVGLKVPRCYILDSRRAASSSARRGGLRRQREEHFSRGAARSFKGRFECWGCSNLFKFKSPL